MAIMNLGSTSGVVVMFLACVARVRRSRHGLAATISEIWHLLLQSCNITKMLISDFNPQSNPTCELGVKKLTPSY